MNKLGLISGLLLLAALCLNIMHSHAQSDINKVGFGVKGYLGGIGFVQPNLKAPMPSAGVGISFLVNTTEVEAGVSYLTKFWETDISGTPNYKKIMYGEHYLNFQLGLHQKLLQVKKHVFSVGVAIGFRTYLGNPIDTLMADGSLRWNKQPTDWRLIHSPGINLEFSFRYTYAFSDRLGLFIAPFLGLSFSSNYSKATSDNDPNWKPPIKNYTPEMDNFAFGLKIGIHFLAHFSKDAPVNFLQKQDMNTKAYRHSPL